MALRPVVILILLAVTMAFGQGLESEIRSIVENIKGPLRIVLVLALAITGFKYFGSRGGDAMQEGNKALTAAIVGIVVFGLAFEIVNMLID